MKRTKITCNTCRRDISKSNHTRHVTRCTTALPKKIRGVDYDPNIGYKDGTRQAWNKGLTVATSPAVDAYNQTRMANYDAGNYQLGGWKHTDKAKQRMSAQKIKYLQENPDKVPYVLNHHSNGPSYPETYWKQILDNTNKNYETEFRVGLYSLDFANLAQKIDLEIDGEQHYTDTRIIASDIRRTTYLTQLGWTVIRVRWSAYMKLSLEERTLFVNDILTQFIF
jgi:very-short-patch-repair endonuclease